MEVQIISRKLITPSSPTPPHLQNLKISSVDQHAPYVYVPTIFYYAANGEEYDVKNAEKSLQMQNSLSEILALYYPFAGRCAKDDPFIECNDKGAEFFEAQVNGSLSQLFGDRELETNLKSHLAPHYFDPSNSSPLAVQFNMFECGGIAIGISLTHKIADAFTVFTFINAWTTASRFGVDQVPCPSFELASIFPPRAASRVENIVTIKAVTNNIVTKMFVFDGVAISKLKEATNFSASGSHQSLNYQVTRVKVVIALIWRCLMRLSQARHGCMRPSLMKVPVNLRGKIPQPIPENSCGNLVSWAVAQFKPGDESEVKLHELVSRINSGIENAFSNYSKATSDDDLFFLVMDGFRKVSKALIENEVDVYMFGCWCRFPMYEADFGWGKPTLVCGGNSQVPRECIRLLDTKDGYGIEAIVSLEVMHSVLPKN